MKPAGKMTHRITFQVRAAGQNTMGQKVSTWTDVFTCWSNVKGLEAKYSTAEEFRGKQFSPEGLWQITVRNTPRVDAITETHRILFGAKTFDIMRIIPGERRMDDKVFFCKERVFVEGDAQ